MKTLLSILIILCSFGANAQQEVNVRNNTTMELELVFFIYNSTCTQISTHNITLAVGANYTTPLLPATEEYVWVEIAPISCSWFGLTVGTPMYCNSNCQEPGIPSAATTGSCSGNYSFVHARWVDCGAPGFGYLGIDEF